jgi:hypothetical protein
MFRISTRRAGWPKSTLKAPEGCMPEWVFTIPKRLRVYFRYDRKLLGKLCRAAFDTVLY